MFALGGAPKPVSSCRTTLVRVEELDVHLQATTSPSPHAGLSLIDRSEL